VLVGLALGHGVWRSSGSSSQAGGNGSSGNGGLFNPFNGGNGGNGSNGASGGSSGAGGPSDAGAIAAKVAPSLVDINTDLSYQGDEAAGTGIVLSSTGLVLTNNHVISEATQIKATDIGNGQTYSGVVVGYDHTHDIAVVQLQHATNLKAASVGDSDRVSVGDPIVGLGNAGGLGGSPSAAGGSVTALNQSITASDEADASSERLAGLIEINANIQPGDSGGALSNDQGQVVGVDTAASAGFSFQTSGGQGFAIPINQALSIVHQIESGQTTASVHVGPTAFLGVLIDPARSRSGATLSSAVPGGPAAKAGLTTGDTITSLAGQGISSSSTLTDLILKYHPGDRVQVGWTDPSGKTHQATITLAPGPAQ
jgi:S1-C subfamily serine protease